MRNKKISVSEFKAKSLGIFERVAKSGESVIVTKRGKPIALVTAYPDTAETPEPGKLRNTLLAEEDLLSPFGEKLWKAAEKDE